MIQESVINRHELVGFRSYAFVIGIDAYEQINAPLTNAVNDATEIARVLKHRQGFDQVRLLTDATGDEIRALLAELADPQRRHGIGKDDCVVFYYAGHGKPGAFDEGPAGFLLPADARPSAATLENDSLIAMEAVYDALVHLGCHHTLLILDCCFAGTFRFVGQKNRDTVTPFFMPMYEERFERYKKKRAWQVLVSAGPDQTAADWLGERQGQCHSPFAEALFKALEGEAEVKPSGKRLGDGVLTAQELYLYLWEQVETLTRNDASARIQYPGLFPMGAHQGGEFIFGDPNNKLNFAERQDRNPYKGLHAYQEADGDLFFGRKQVITDLLARLDEMPVVIVSAPSGTGKSSVVRAGLVPRLKKEPYHFETLKALRPGATPAQALLTLLRDEASTKKEDVSAAEWDHYFSRAGKHVLLLDQYEECFTDCDDLDERARFEALLLDLVKHAPPDQFKLVITIRSDFDWQMERSAFGKAYWKQDHLYRLPAMTLDDLREALVQPALREVYDFEDEELINTILADINNAPGALPMLSFTMSELYRITDKQTRLFTKKDYLEKLGGVTGALSKRADAIYEGLASEMQRATMRKIMLRMVNLEDGGYIRRRVSYIDRKESAGAQGLHELDYPDDAEDALVREVVDILEKAHLVMVNVDQQGQSFVEPVHDSLINRWATCRAWIEGFGKDRIMLQRQVWEAVRTYHHSGNDTKKPETPHPQTAPEPNADFLWDTDPRLDQMEQIVGLDEGNWLNEPEHDFVQASLARRSAQARRKARRRRNTMLAIGVAGLVALILAFVAEQQRRVAEEKARIAQSRQLAAVAINKLEAGDIDGALLLSVEANTIQVTAESESSLLQGRQYSARMKQGLHGHQGGVRNVAFSPDGTKLAAATGEGTVHLWDLTRGVRLGQPFRGDMSQVGVASVAFSPDGTRLASGGVKATMNEQGVFQEGAVGLWDVTPNGSIEQPLWYKGGMPAESIGGGVQSVAFSPQGNVLVAAGKSGMIQFWDVVRGEPLTEPLPAHRGGVQSVTFSPDGSNLLTAGLDGTIRYWDARRGMPLTTPFLVDEKGVNSAAFSPDGTKLALGSGSGTVWLWDVPRGTLLWYNKAGQGTVFSVAFSPTGDMVASAGWDGTVHLWDAAQGTPLGEPLRGHESQVVSVAFSPDGTLASAGADGTVWLWDVTGGESLDALLPVDQGMIQGVAFSPTGDTLVSAGEDGTLWLWDASRGTPLGEPLSAHPGGVSRLVFSPDGASLVSTGADGAVLLWDVTGETPSGTPLPGHPGGVQSVAYNPTGDLLVWAGWDIQFWDVARGLPFGVPLPGHSGQAMSVAFSPTGDTLVSVGMDGMLKLWDVTRGLPLGEPLPAHQGWALHVAYSPEGRRLASAGMDSTIRLWNASNGEPVGAPFRGHTNAIYSLAFNPDGRKLASAGLDGTLRLWDLDPASWKERVCRIVGRNLTQAEWNQYIGAEVPYRRTCPRWPAGKGTNLTWQAQAAPSATLGQTAISQGDFDAVGVDTQASMPDQIVSSDTLEDVPGPAAFAAFNPSPNPEVEAATPAPRTVEPEVFEVAEQMPEPLGGLKAIQREIRYPRRAERAGIEGRVIIHFIVDKNGNVIDPVVVRGIGWGCDEEALRVVRAARFRPGSQSGRPVNVKMSLPIRFKLR